MSEKTKERIKNVIEELDYRPNFIARSLKSKKTGLIGVIMSDITNPVSINLVKGVIDHCTKEGYQVVTASSNEDTVREKEYVLSMVDRQVEGLIVNIVDYQDYDLLKSLSERGIKIVLADRTVCDSHFDMVTTDNYDMTRATIKAMYERGFNTVGFFSSSLLKSNVRLSRYNAFLDESVNHVPKPDELVYLLNDDEYKQSLDEFIQNSEGQRSAIFASTPMALLNVVSAMQELNMRIPEDLGVCGYDNLPWTKLVDGGITVVEQPFYEVGVESAKILIGKIRNGEGDSPKYVELKSKLILRNSTNI
jgi:LacI family kdg operon repressor